MGDSLQKAFFGVIALGGSCIAIELMPISRQAAYWNGCFNSTFEWINEATDFKEWDKNARESIAVGVCNGAVYETKLKIN